MLDELYDDVLSVMSEHGFVTWFAKNKQTHSPLKWCYDNEGSLKPITKPPKDLVWLVNTYNEQQHNPIELTIDSCGIVGPRKV